MSIRLQQNWSNSLLLIFAISIWKKERHKFCENLCVVTSKRDYYVQEHRSRLRGYVRSIMQTTQESKSRTQISSRGGRASNRRRSRLQAVSCLDGRLCRRPLCHNSHAGKSLANCSVSEEAAAAIVERLWRSWEEEKKSHDELTISTSICRRVAGGRSTMLDTPVLVRDRAQHCYC